MSPSALRQTVLRVAGALFAAHGPDGVAMRRIAQACEMHLPPIYQAFGSKQALYDACRESAHRRGAEAIAAAMDGAGPDDAARLDAFAHAVCARFEADHELRAFVLQDEWRQVAWLDGSAPLAAVFDAASASAARACQVPRRAARDALGVFAVLSLARGMAARTGGALPEPATILALAIGPAGAGSARRGRSARRSAPTR